MGASERSCPYCHAVCNTHVAAEEGGVPLPMVAFGLMIAGVLGYLTMYFNQHGFVADDYELDDVKIGAVGLGLLGFCIGLVFDLIMWAFNKRKK